MTNQDITDGWNPVVQPDLLAEAIERYSTPVYQTGRGIVPGEYDQSSTLPSTLRRGERLDASPYTRDRSLGGVATSDQAYPPAPITPDGWDATPHPDPVSDIMDVQKVGVERAGQLPVPLGHIAINPTTQG